MLLHAPPEWRDSCGPVARNDESGPARRKARLVLGFEYPLGSDVEVDCAALLVSSCAELRSEHEVTWQFASPNQPPSLFMKSFIACSAAALGVATIADVANAMQAYLNYLPNGSLFSQELGHPDNDSSQYTDFATAFEAVGLSWTAAFCADTFPNSDMTNGAAFGDPCCTWSQGGTPDFTVTPFTTDPTTATVCATASSATTSTAASTAASTTSSATTDTSTTSTATSTTSSATTDTSTTFIAASTASSAATATTSTAASSTTDTTPTSTTSSATTDTSTETTAPSTDSNPIGGGCRAKSHKGKKNGLRA